MNEKDKRAAERVKDMLAREAEIYDKFEIEFEKEFKMTSDKTNQTLILWNNFRHVAANSVPLIDVIREVSHRYRREFYIEKHAPNVLKKVQDTMLNLKKMI